MYSCTVCTYSSISLYTVEVAVTRVVRGKDRLGDSCGEVAMELVNRVHNYTFKHQLIAQLSLTLNP